jgi:hypothetical protein
MHLWQRRSWRVMPDRSVEFGLVRGSSAFRELTACPVRPTPLPDGKGAHK